IRKDRLFVFGSYEGLRIRPAALATAAFPLTAAERGGDFSATRTPGRDPLTAQPFPDNRIPANRIDPVSGHILSRNLMPLPTRSDGQFVGAFPLPQNNDSGLIRVDYNLRRHVIDGRYHYNLARAVESFGDIPAYASLDRRNTAQTIVLGDTFTATPS